MGGTCISGHGVCIRGNGQQQAGQTGLWLKPIAQQARGLKFRASTPVTSQASLQVPLTLAPRQAEVG